MQKKKKESFSPSVCFIFILLISQIITAGHQSVVYDQHRRSDLKQTEVKRDQTIVQGNELTNAGPTIVQSNVQDRKQFGGKGTHCL